MMLKLSGEKMKEKFDMKNWLAMERNPFLNWNRVNHKMVLLRIKPQMRMTMKRKQKSKELNRHQYRQKKRKAHQKLKKLKIHSRRMKMI